MKNGAKGCEYYQELIPLWFNDSLSEPKLASLQTHLHECRGCSRRLATERRLFAEAKTSGDELLPDDVDSSLLDRYVFEPDSLSEREQTAIEEGIRQSPILADVLNRLRSLPPTLDELVPPEERQKLDRMDADRASRTGAGADPESIVDRRSRTWIGWLAAAAAVILVGVVVVRLWLGDRPTARLDVTLPAAVRGGQEISFTTPASPFVLDARMYIGPEEGHRYNIELLPIRNDSVLLRLEDYQAFDQAGFADFSVPLDTGRYRVRIYDIYGGDTLLVTRPFEVRLTP
jgi:hypothetical protein